MRIIRNSICPLVGQEPESDKHRRTRPHGGLLLVQRQPTWCPQGDHAVTPWRAPALNGGTPTSPAPAAYLQPRPIYRPRRIVTDASRASGGGYAQSAVPS